MKIPAAFPEAALLFFLALGTFRAQVPATQESACLHSRSVNETVSHSLSNGATITVRPSGANDPRQGCEVVVRDKSGKIVFSDRGFSTKIDPATGHDIDNDGQPDAVVGVDTGGENHCCWEYPVLSFSPTPRVLVKLPPASFDYQTKPGRTLVWTSASFNNLATSTGDTPIVATVHELRSNGFVDVTADYCKVLLSGELRGIGNLNAPLATLTRQAKQDSRTDGGRAEDREDTRVAATTVILQQIYCGQFDEASRTVLEVWPASAQSRIRKEIKDAVADRWPDLAKRLGAWN